MWPSLPRGGQALFPSFLQMTKIAKKMLTEDLTKRFEDKRAQSTKEGSAKMSNGANKQRFQK